MAALEALAALPVDAKALAKIEKARAETPGLSLLL